MTLHGVASPEWTTCGVLIETARSLCDEGGRSGSGVKAHNLATLPATWLHGVDPIAVFCRVLPCEIRWGGTESRN